MRIPTTAAVSCRRLHDYGTRDTPFLPLIRRGPSERHWVPDTDGEARSDVVEMTQPFMALAKTAIRVGALPPGLE